MLMRSLSKAVIGGPANVDTLGVLTGAIVNVAQPHPEGRRLAAR